MPEPSKLTTAAMPLTNVTPASIASGEHPAIELHFDRGRDAEVVLESHRSSARVPIFITVAKPEFSELLSFTPRPVSTQA